MRMIICRTALGISRVPSFSHRHKMMPAFLLVAFLLAGQTSTLRGSKLSVLTLRGSLVVVELDYNGDRGQRRTPTTQKETDYYLQQRDGALLSLQFPAGEEPPDRFGSGLQLEVQVPASDLDTALIGGRPSAAARRSLAERGAHGAQLTAAPHHSSSHSYRRMRPGDSNDDPEWKPRHDGQEHGRQGNGGASSDSQRSRGPHPQHLIPQGESRNFTVTALGAAEPARGTGNPARALLGAKQVKAADAGSLNVLTWRIVGDMPGWAGGNDPRDGSGDSHFIYNDQRLLMDDVSTVVFILDMCGRGPAATKEQVEYMLFDRPASNLKDFFSSCSYGQARFSHENTLVLGPVTLDCQGSIWGADWRTSSCTGDDYYGWQWQAEQWAWDNNIPISAYRHRAVITSPGHNIYMTEGDRDCSWSGVGTVGPADNEEHNLDNSDLHAIYTKGVFSYIWISGDHWMNPQSWIHELGHNYYLGHASLRDGCKYCDDSCAMGYCCETRCFNSPHNWQLGWEAPAFEFNDFLLQPGRTWGFNLQAQVHPFPPQPVSGTFIRINAPWFRDYGDYDLGGTTTIWVSYRLSTYPYDMIQQDMVGVSVYLYPGEWQHDATDTVRVASLPPGGIWRNTTLGLSVQWPELGYGQQAYVKVCRFIADAETACNDGQDNDCDGFVDSADPDCPASISPPPPDAPPPPSPPPAGSPYSSSTKDSVAANVSRSPPPQPPRLPFMPGQAPSPADLNPLSAPIMPPQIVPPQLPMPPLPSKDEEDEPRNGPAAPPAYPILPTLAPPFQPFAPMPPTYASLAQPPPSASWGYAPISVPAAPPPIPPPISTEVSATAPPAAPDWGLLPLYYTPPAPGASYPPSPRSPPPPRPDPARATKSQPVNEAYSPPYGGRYPLPSYGW